MQSSSDESSQYDEKKEGSGRLRDMFRRAVSAGAGVIFAQEGETKERRGALELPKEVLQYMLGAADDLRDSILRIVGSELGRFLQALDLGNELQKILTSTSFEIKTEIRFIPNEQSVVKPSVTANVQTKRVEPPKRRSRSKTPKAEKSSKPKKSS